MLCHPQAGLTFARAAGDPGRPNLRRDLPLHTICVEVPAKLRVSGEDISMLHHNTVALSDL
jgi:hypothetical protein